MKSDPLTISALASAVFAGISYVGKQVFNLVHATIKRESERADRLEEKLFTTQALVYPVLEAANTAIREALLTAKKES